MITQTVLNKGARCDVMFLNRSNSAINVVECFVIRVGSFHGMDDFNPVGLKFIQKL